MPVLRFPAVPVLVSAMLLLSGPAFGLGEEEFGNKPMSPENFKTWPGIVSTVNHTSRAYRVWVNGNEFFYYKGNTDTLNDVLRTFAEAKTPNLQIVLRPGPGKTTTFDGKTVVNFDWDLHLMGGISAHVAKLPMGDKVWSTAPVLTIYVGGGIDLKKLTIPKGPALLSVNDVKRRVAEGLKSTHITVRGWGAGELAKLDAFDNATVTLLTGLLKDEDKWVQLNAAHSIPLFGRKAATALPLLRTLAESTDANLADAAKKAFASIESAPDTTAAEQSHREVLESIGKFVAKQVAGGLDSHSARINVTFPLGSDLIQLRNRIV